MAWLGNYKYRVKADIDYTDKIGGSVTQFPLTIFIDSTSGVGSKDLTAVFDEVGNSYQKIAVTKSFQVLLIPVPILKIPLISLFSRKYNVISTASFT